MLTHEEMVAKMLQNPTVHAEVERPEREEMPMFDAIPQARIEAGLTQAQVAATATKETGNHECAH